LQDKDSRGVVISKTIKIRGLNKVLLELDEDAVLGDLNSTSLDFEFLSNEKWIRVLITPEFESWNDDKALVFEDINSETIEFSPGGNTVIEDALVLHFNRYSTLVSLKVKPYDLLELVDTTSYFNSIDNIKKLLPYIKQKR